uniref:Uncharacterized protein n=1 Tax=Anopheles atroparvus TaxID=41427 RepID=A0AAG5CR91_ANOAO
MGDGPEERGFNHIPFIPFFYDHTYVATGQLGDDVHRQSPFRGRHLSTV